MRLLRDRVVHFARQIRGALPSGNPFHRSMPAALAYDPVGGPRTVLFKSVED